jgi:hypothetical protein
MHKAYQYVVILGKKLHLGRKIMSGHSQKGRQPMLSILLCFSSAVIFPLPH